MTRERETILVRLPAARVPARRGAALDLVVEASGIAANVISLLQGPTTVRDLAAALREWARGPTAPVRSAIVSAEGPAGRVELELTDDIDLDEVAQLLPVHRIRARPRVTHPGWQVLRGARPYVPVAPERPFPSRRRCRGE